MKAAGSLTRSIARDLRIGASELEREGREKLRQAAEARAAAYELDPRGRRPGTRRRRA